MREIKFNFYIRIFIKVSSFLVHLGAGRKDGRKKGRKEGMNEGRKEERKKRELDMA